MSRREARDSSASFSSAEESEVGSDVSVEEDEEEEVFAEEKKKKKISSKGSSGKGKGKAKGMSNGGSSSSSSSSKKSVGRPSIPMAKLRSVDLVFFTGELPYKYVDGLSDGSIDPRVVIAALQQLTDESGGAIKLTKRVVTTTQGGTHDENSLLSGLLESYFEGQLVDTNYLTSLAAFAFSMFEIEERQGKAASRSISNKKW